MRVLVTGATGGLGINLVLRLINEGYTVCATGRNQQIGAYLQERGALFIHAHLDDADSIGLLCADKDVIFHCGALSSPWGPYQDFYKANVIGTQNIVRGCLKHKVPRLVHVSTPSLYFDFTEKHGIKENNPLPQKFVNSYAHTKWLAEQYIDQAHRTHNLSVLTIRPRALFGPHETCIMPRLIRAARTGLPLINQGQAIIDVTYIENVVDSLLLCAQASPIYSGRKYNITNNEPTTLKALLERVCESIDQPFTYKNMSYGVGYALATLMEGLYSLPFIKKEPPLTRYGAGVFSFGQTLDISAAQTDLGYAPRISLQKGIELYGQWWKSQHEHL